MKYIVMECHKGYAVLMDEESRYMKAANLRYVVGQTVTTPVLMEFSAGEERRISFYVTRFAAAAACLALAVSAGSFYYTREGDSIYFNPTYLHGQRCVGDSKARFLTMIAE